MSKKKDQRAAKAGSARLMLTAVPHQNRVMKLEPRTGGGMLATIPMRRPGYMVPPISWFVPYSPHRRVELDRLGAAVLNLCDGKRSVEEIIERFARDNKLSFREAQLCVTQFLTQLSQRGLIAIIGRNEDASEQ